MKIDNKNIQHATLSVRLNISLYVTIIDYWLWYYNNSVYLHNLLFIVRDKNNTRQEFTATSVIIYVNEFDRLEQVLKLLLTLE